MNQPPNPEERISESAPDATTDQSPATPAPGLRSPNATVDYVSRESAGASNPDGTVDRGEASSDDVEDLSFALSVAPKPRPVTDPGDSVAGYEILEVLGRGAMGVVYKARHTTLKRIVALKMILAGDQADERERGRFRIEAEAAAQLQHPNIVQVYEVGEQNGRSFLSLEYVNGGSLKDRLRGTPQPVSGAAELVQVLAQAMDYAHGQGIIHRDLKPGNVMLMQTGRPGSSDSTLTATPIVDQLYGVPKIADFGLAKRLESDSGQTRSGTILGTPSYMAPEQAEGRSKDVGPLADQHALGAVLYELLTGRPPFHGATMWETLEQVRFQEPVPPSRLQPRVPRDLETICLKCLQKEPGKRYAHAAALAEDLHRFIRGEPILARPVSTPERVLRWCRRNPKVAGLVGVVLVLLVVGLAGLSYFNIKLAAEKQAAVEARQLAEKNERIALANEETAKENWEIAMGQRTLALGSLEAVLKRVYDQLKDKPRLQGLRRDILKSAMEDLDKVADNVDVQVSRKDAERAKARMELGHLYLGGGAIKKALEQNEKAYEILKTLEKKSPNSAIAKANLTLPLMQMGFLFLKMKGDIVGARAKFLEAKKILEDLDQNPLDKSIPLAVIKSHLAAALQRLGSVTIDSDPAEALSYYQAALKQRLALWEQSKDNAGLESDLAEVYLMVGGAYFCLRDESAARKNYELAMQIRDRLAERDPGNRGMQRSLGFALQRCGDIELRTKHVQAARDKYTRAKVIYEKLVKEDPDMVDYQDDLARANYDLGNVALREENAAEAEKNFQESLRTRKERASADPDDLSAKKNYMTTLARCGDHVTAARMAGEILKTLEDSDSLIEAAYCYAVSVAAVEKGKEKSPLSEEDRKIQKEYLARSIEAMRKAVSRGYRNIVNLETEPDLDSIRQKPEFHSFVGELRQSLAAKTGAG